MPTNQPWYINKTQSSLQGSNQKLGPTRTMPLSNEPIPDQSQIVKRLLSEADFRAVSAKEAKEALEEMSRIKVGSEPDRYRRAFHRDKCMDINSEQSAFDIAQRRIRRDKDLLQEVERVVKWDKSIPVDAQVDLMDGTSDEERTTKGDWRKGRYQRRYFETMNGVGQEKTIITGLVERAKRDNKELLMDIKYTMDQDWQLQNMVNFQNPKVKDSEIDSKTAPSNFIKSNEADAKIIKDQNEQQPTEQINKSQSLHRAHLGQERERSLLKPGKDDLDLLHGTRISNIKAENLK